MSPAKTTRPIRTHTVKHLSSTIIFLAVSLAASVGISDRATADIVCVSHNFVQAVDIVTNSSGVSVNQGGLGTGATTTHTGTILDFLITIDDTAGTGAIFEATMTLAGVLGNGNAGVRAAGNGQILAGGGTGNTDMIVYTVSAITQVSGPAATATFDGFPSITVNQFNNAPDPANGVLGDALVFDNEQFVSPGNNGNSNFLIDPPGLAPNGVTMDAGNPNATPPTGSERFRHNSVDLKFTVEATAIPEPSSICVLALAGLGLLICRKR